MNIYTVSDIHLEFAGHTPHKPTTSGRNVLSIAGDVFPVEMLNTKAMRTVAEDYFDKCSEYYDDVVVIAGNHEWYDSYIHSSKLADFYSMYDNVHFLDTNSVTIEDVVFVGTTLWTNFNNENLFAIDAARRQMNDFRYIHKYRTSEDGKIFSDIFSPEDAIKLYYGSVDFIDTVCGFNKDKTIVVVTHHSPTYSTMDKQYLGSALTHSYASGLEWLIDRHRNIKLWHHGHSHHACHIHYPDGTSIICNPRGYQSITHLEDTGFNESKYVKLV